MNDVNSKMFISHIHIENFKGFYKDFNFDLKKGFNIIVGDNEAGKSTILEAINLALSGVLDGRYIRNDISQYVFNNRIVDEYIKSVQDGNPIPPPYVLIELFIEGENISDLEGNNNYKKERSCGIQFKIEFDETYQNQYQQLISSQRLITLPIEYYDIEWNFFSADPVNSRSIPLKASLIDSSKHRYRNGSDIYISRIVKDILHDEEVIAISQAHRQLKETFMSEQAIQDINEKIKGAINVTDKDIRLSVDLSTSNAWETSLMTYLDEIPFQQVGKGEQTLIKTKLALSHRKAEEANVILLEEPENHLSHSNLNQLLRYIKELNHEKQIIISTHSSFVANKLGLLNLILLHDHKTTTFDSLKPDTQTFFERLAGYDTLRLILCKKAILVEGDSDELVVQKAYMCLHNGRLPIEDKVEVISVGLSFLRFLEIAEKINKRVVIITDNDGNITSLESKYSNYIGVNKKETIGIFYDSVVDECENINNEQFNCNTLEPKIAKENGLDNMNKILGKNYSNENDLHKFMKNNKTECALRLFNYQGKIIFPKYILDAIKDE